MMMQEKPFITEKERATLTIPECVSRAEGYIQDTGMCLLLMDAVGSTQVEDANQWLQEVREMIADINTTFADHLPENDLMSRGRTITGFDIVAGDGIHGTIDDSAVIPEIADLIATRYPHIMLRYGVARNGYDSEGIALLK